MMTPWLGSQPSPPPPLRHPRPYPDLARYGFRWIKVHRYWFGYLPGTSPVITNIFDEAGDIPTHMSGESVPLDVA